MSKWDEIAASQEFRDADRETREATRQMFWREVIRPQTNEANRARTKRMFLDATSSHVAREQLSDDVEPSQGVGGGRGGQGGPTAEQMGANAPKPVGLFSSLKEAFAPGPSMSSETAAAMLDQPADSLKGQRPLIEQRGAPVTAEFFDAARANMEMRSPADRGLAGGSKGWRGSVARAATDSIEAAKAGGRTAREMAGGVEGRAERYMRKGVEEQTARSMATADIASGTSANVRFAAESYQEPLSDAVVRKASDLSLAAAKIPPTVLKGFADLAQLASNGAVGADASGLMVGANAAIDDAKSTGAKIKSVQFKRASEAGTGATAFNYLLDNPDLLLEEAIPSIGSMVTPIMSAGVATRIAQAGKWLKALPAAERAAAIEKVREAVVIGASAAQNAADTFVETKGSAADRYTAAGIAATGTMLAGKAFGGGAEAAASRMLAGVSTPAAAGFRGAAGDITKGLLNEGAQEGFESVSQSVGQQVGETGGVDPRKAIREGVVGATLGAVIGGGMPTAQRLSQAFVNVADAHGMSPKAAAAIQAQAAQMPPEQATAFVERAIAAVEKRGLVKRIGAALSWRKAVETPGTQPEIINNPAAPTAAEMGWATDDATPSGAGAQEAGGTAAAIISAPHESTAQPDAPVVPMWRGRQIEPAGQTIAGPDGRQYQPVMLAGKPQFVPLDEITQGSADAGQDPSAVSGGSATRGNQPARGTEDAGAGGLQRDGGLGADASGSSPGVRPAAVVRTGSRPDAALNEGGPPATNAPTPQDDGAQTRPQAGTEELAGEDWAGAPAGLDMLGQQADAAGIDTGTLREDVARGLGDAATDAEYSQAVATALTQAIKAKTGRAPTMPTNMATRGAGVMGTKVDAKAGPGFSAADVARKPDVSKKAPETNTSPERVQESPKTEQIAPASQAEVAPAPPPAGPVAAERPAEPVIEHVTGKGKTLTGYVRNVPAAEAVKMDSGTFRRKGADGTVGYFVRKDRADAWDAANGKAQSAAPAQAQPVGATGEGAAVSRPTPEPVVSAATAPSLRQPNGSDTKKAEAPFKKPTIEKKPAPRKSALAAEGQKAAQKRADYFTPGNIIKSYSGHDEVLEYAPGENGEWKVKVHSVVKKDGEWVREGKPQDARWHSTEPELRALVAGPVERLGYSESPRYTQPRADGAPFPGMPARGVKPAEQPATKPEDAPADDALDDELLDALGKLGDVLGDVFGAKLNITGTQHTAGDLLPALSKVVELLVRKGFKSFRGATGKAAQIMRADPRTAPHVDSISARQWRAAYQAIAEMHPGTDSEDAVNAMTADDVKAIVAGEKPAAQPDGSLADVLDKAIATGNMPKDNPALRKLVEQFDGQPATPERMKVAQESLEAAIVRRARALVQMGADERTTFDSLLALYQSQPNLNIRTSTSIDNQAYSTPAPLAYLGARLAGIGPRTKMYEPTAGNGMLAITAKPANVTATEIGRQRFEVLKAQGINVTQGDALEAKVPAKSQDAVHTNPPFGPIKAATGESIKVKVDGYTLGQIDHLIAARALETMKDDGTATLIIGANKVAGGQSNNDLIFFNWLYGHYNVTSHFEVDGDLYGRQGASWPVRVITINGRAESTATAPKPGAIGRANTWEEVYERFQQGLAAARRGAGDGNAVVGARPGPADDARAVPADAGSQARRPDPGRPEGGTPRAGDVAGGGPRTVVDRGAAADQPMGERAGAVRPDDAPAVEGGWARVPGRVEAGRPAGDSGTAGVGNQFQMPYVARSARKDEGVLIPVNMAQPTQDALNRIEDEVGQIDEFVIKELGYKGEEELHRALMGLQVDSVAAAIYQIKNGKGLISSDMTGVGKGRQAAAIIRWAAKNGHIPVFVTVKPSLFTDMHGDLADIGSHDIAPFIVNSAESIKGAGDEKLFANKPGTHKKTLEKIVETAALPAGRNAVFMTYSQINVQNTQRDALLALASRHPGGVVFILDESHNAGGDSATGSFIKEVLDLSKGVFYLSATYAKRPDNMPVYFKTDIGEAVADDDTLMSAMEAGGLPLQTVVANNLVKAGQMFRRERSYDGVNIESRADTAHRAEHVTMSDSTTLALRAIVQADRTFHENYVKALQKELEEAGGRALDMAGNQAQQSVDHTQFSSVVHNFVRQMLLGLKAQEAADDAIRSLKRGEKPLIAVENTMGSFLAEYAENNGLKVGDELGSFDYRTVLSRALERSRYIIRQLPNGNKVREYIPMGKLDTLSFEAYTQAQKVINSLKIDIPVSPIDWMRNEITKAGFTVAEVTGRNLSVDYSGKRPKLDQIDPREQKDKVHTTRQFNSGKLDALILNVAGSTGISLHASEKFTDQRQRHMIVAQAAQDINIFMQMLGRVHRTGQVNLPKYTILSADLPAEIRPTALLSAKMKSLNANTSSNTESATSVKAADMLNKYGDQIVGQYLADNPELAQALSIDPPSPTGDGAEDIARKATGRLALMPVKVQEQFYAEVEEQYQSLMEYLNKTNQNDLEPRTFDLDAKETKSALLFEGQNKASPFGEDAIYGEYSIKAQGKAMTPDEIRAAMAENLAGKSEAAYSRAMIDTLQTAYDAYFIGLGNGDSSKQVPLRAGAEQVRRSTIDFIAGHRIGSVFRVEINGDTYNAIVTNIRSTHKASGNPFSLSKVQVTVALNGALRSITVPATQFAKIEVSGLTGYGGRIDSLFKVGPPNERETAKIVTGNLLGAYGELNGTRGSIITFTKGDGSTEQGILLPKSFNFAKDVRQDYRLKTPADAVAFLSSSKDANIDRFGINSRDQNVRVLPHGKGGVTIQVPKSKLKGGKYFLNPKLRAITGDFISVGGFMRATVTGKAEAVKALDVLMQMNALYTVPSMQEEARTILNDPAPTAGPATEPTSRFSLGAQQQQASERVQSDVDAITATWANAPEVVVAFDMADTLVPKEARDAYRKLKASGAQGSPEGFFLGGKVYLMAGNLATPADTARVMAHEALGHAGLSGVFGEQLGAMLDRLAKALPEKVGAKAAQYGLNISKPADRRHAAEEYLAELAQTRPSSTWVQKAIALIKAWAREHVPGLGAMKMNDAEVIARFVEPARGFVERGRGKADGAVRFGLSPQLPATIDIDGQQRPTTNSKGRQIAATEEGVRAFYRWFKGSKVVDSDGRPLVVYHGSGVEFDEFDPGRLGETTGYGDAEVGFHFSNNKADASHYAELAARKADEAEGGDGWGKTGVVREFYLSLQNPLMVGMDESDGNAGERTQEFLDDKNEADSFAAENGMDGIIYLYGTNVDSGYTAIAFQPEQIKSATGNVGTFDPADPDIRFSLGQPLSGATPPAQLFGAMATNTPKDGVLNWWHKSLGKPYNLAQKYPAFKRVYDATQRYIQDATKYTTEAAMLAPDIIPSLDHLADIIPKRVRFMGREFGKEPLNAADNKMLAATVFHGTLLWTRDKGGKPIKVTDVEDLAETLDTEQKARIMMRDGKVMPDIVRRMQENPLDIYDGWVRNQFEKAYLKPGIVFTPAELKTIFGANDKQVKHYQQYRNAVDKSLTDLAVSDMLRLGGDDVAGLVDRAMLLADPKAAAEMVATRLREIADQDPARVAALAKSEDLNKQARKLNEQADKLEGRIPRMGGVEEEIDDARAELASLRKRASALTAEAQRERIGSGRYQSLNETANIIIDKSEKVADLMARGYAPLMRFGTHKVDVVDADGKRVYFGLFETRAEAAKMARKMADEFPGATITRGTLSKREHELYAGVTPETLELFGEMLGLDAQGNAASDEAFQTYIKYFKNQRSAMKRLIHRKGIAGFSEDAGRVLAGFVFSNGRQTAGNLHASSISRSMKAIPREQGELMDEAIGMVKAVMDPTEGFATLRQLLFAHFLGGNVSSAVINASQVVMNTLPYLSQWGARGAAKEISKAYTYMTGRTARDAGLDAALHRADEEGITAPQEIHMVMAQARGKATLRAGDGTPKGAAFAAAANGAARVGLAWGKPFAWAEALNRRASFIAAYRTALKKGLGDPYAFAKKVVEETQYVANKGNRSRVERNPFGQVLLTFKGFGTQTIELMHRLWTQGEKGSAERAQGRKAVWMMLGLLVLMGGTAGIPFIGGDLDDFIDGILQRLGLNWVTRAKKEKLVKKAVGRVAEMAAVDPALRAEAEDVAWRMFDRGISGLPGMPTDISGRFSMGNMLPGTGLLPKTGDKYRDTAELFGPAGSFAQTYLEAMGLILGGLGEAAVTSSMAPAAEGAWRGVAHAAPTGVKNALKGAEMLKTGQYNDMDGKKVTATSTSDALWKMVGFQPNSVARKRLDESTDADLIALNKDAASRIVHQIAKGLDEKDDARVERAMALLNEWNTNYPESAINGQRLVSAVKARMIKMNSDSATRLLKSAPKSMRPGLMSEVEH